MSKDTHSIRERKTKTVQPDMNTSIAWEKIEGQDHDGATGAKDKNHERRKVCHSQLVIVV